MTRPWSTGWRFIVFSVVLFGSFGLRSLPGMDVYTKIEVDGNVSLSLPGSWKVVDRAAPDKGTTGGGIAAGAAQSSSLLLTARPSDPAQKVSISLFRINVHTKIPPVYGGEAGSQALLENALNVVLSMGFTPSKTQVTRLTSLKETPLITAEITASNSAPAAPAETPAQVSTSGAQLVQNNHASFVIVEGQKGVGSGFICTQGGKDYIITNAHVISDNSGIKFKSLNGSQFTPGAAGVAGGHDIVRIEAQTPAKPLEIMTGIDEAMFDSHNAYDYFRRQALEEQQLREKIQAILTKELESRM